MVLKYYYDSLNKKPNYRTQKVTMLANKTRHVTTKIFLYFSLVYLKMITNDEFVSIHYLAKGLFNRIMLRPL